ncbi:MAG: ABC transporter permease subunit [Alicyclobacillus sp.]|nr:ABC transporter permease subunit [Alicyclobacillus sp.]
MVKPFTKRLIQCGTMCGFLFIWQCGAALGLINPDILPSPWTILQTLLVIIQDPDVQAGMAATGLEILIAVVVTLPLAILLGMAVVASRHGERSVAPYIQLGNAVPKSIFLPVFIFLFGIGLVQKVIVGGLHGFFTVMLNAMGASKSVPDALVTTARFYGANKFQIFTRVYFPCMLPVLLQGIRLGVVLCVTGVLVAEMYVSRMGIGNLLNLWGTTSKVPQLMAGITLIGLFTVVLNELIRCLEHRFGAWRQSMSGR